MLRKFGYSRKWIGKALWVLLLVFSVGMAERKLITQSFDNLVVKLEGDKDTQFLNDAEIEKLATENGSDPFKGSRLTSVDLHAMEERIKANKLVAECSAYRDLEGNIVVKIRQHQPLGRWVAVAEQDEWRNSTGFYVNTEGGYMPLSKSYTARTMLLSGSFFTDRRDLQGEEGARILSLLKFIDADEFWKAQVAEVRVLKDGEVFLFTSLGDQQIEFGPAEGISSKLNKLRVFYQKVLKEDWNRYSKVSIKYRNQVVCE